MASEDELPEEELSAEEEIGSDEEEERGSSAEEGGDDDEDDGSDDGEEGSDDSPTARGRPRKKHRPFVVPPPRALPARTTRGARMGKVEAEEGDEEFWNQEFFAEEANDERYETESEPEDRFDRDFGETEDEGDEEEEAAEAEAEAKANERKKKALKPPGYKKPPLPKPVAGAPRPKPVRPSGGAGEFVAQRRTVRDSTRQKVEEGEMERKLAEKYKPRRAPQRSAHYRPLTQAELLAEAARTEIENTRSLELLEAIEEETKRKAAVQKRRYGGPMVRWRSRRVGEEEVSTLEVRNMAVPDHLLPQTAPPPPPRAVCAVTGEPARYRDPATGLPYASLAAFKELRRRRDAGLLAPAAPDAPAAAFEQAWQPPDGAPRQSTRRAAAAQQQQHVPGLLQQPLGQEALYGAPVLATQQALAGGLGAQSPAAFFPPAHAGVT